MKVLIAGRTKMSGLARCIGGLSEDGTPVRLLNQQGANWDTTAPFQVGQVWDLDFSPAKNTIKPHTEDVIVTRQRFVGIQPNLREYLLAKTNPSRGSINNIFEEPLGFTQNNNGYVCHRLGVPKFSTTFWIPDADLDLRADGKHYDYFQFNIVPRGLSYVGEPHPPQRLPKGTLIRVSLARWWKPDGVDGLEERCYLQLSGWF
jgi:hypothetical protein